MMLSPGVRLGPYEVLDSLGAGGMGEVFRISNFGFEDDLRTDILLSVRICAFNLLYEWFLKHRRP